VKISKYNMLDPKERFSDDGAKMPKFGRRQKAGGTCRARLEPLARDRPAVHAGEKKPTPA
jgi:hypothetical protein